MAGANPPSSRTRQSEAVDPGRDFELESTSWALASACSWLLELASPVAATSPFNASVRSCTLSRRSGAWESCSASLLTGSLPEVLIVDPNRESRGACHIGYPEAVSMHRVT